MITFLNETSKKKIHLLNYLVNNKYSVSVDELANDLNLSTRTITRICQSLKQDINELTKTTSFLIQVSKGVVTLNFSLNSRPSYLINILSINYLKESMKFQVLDSLLTKKFSSVNELADYLYLSPSNIYNYLYQLEPILEVFDLTVDWNSEKKGFNFIYNEKKIRYLAYLFYWYTLKGYVSIGDYDNIIEFNESTYTILNSDFIVKSRQLDYLVYLTTLYIEKQDNPVSLSKENQQALSCFVHSKDFSSILDESISKNEKLFFNLLVRVCLPGIDKSDSIKEIVNNIKKKDLVIMNYCQYLHNQLTKHFDFYPTEEDSNMFYYHMILLSLFNVEIGVCLLDTKILKQFNMEFYENLVTNYPNVPNLVQSIIEEVNQKYKQPAMNEYLIYLISWLFLTKKRTSITLKIAIYFSRNPLGNEVIQNNISKVFNLELIEFTEDIKKADLIISDCSYIESYQIDFFFLEELSKPIVWENLYKVIHQKLNSVMY